jgi:DNA primase
MRWDELGGIYPTDFTIKTVPGRLESIGDLWANIMETKIDIVKLFSTLENELPNHQ